MTAYSATFTNNALCIHPASSLPQSCCWKITHGSQFFLFPLSLLPLVSLRLPHSIRAPIAILHTYIKVTVRPLSFLPLLHIRLAIWIFFGDCCR